MLENGISIVIPYLTETIHNWNSKQQFDQSQFHQSEITNIVNNWKPKHFQLSHCPTMIISTLTGEGPKVNKWELPATTSKLFYIYI